MAPYFSDRTSQTHPSFVDRALSGNLPTDDFKLFPAMRHCLTPDVRPDSYHSGPVEPFQSGNSLPQKYAWDQTPISHNQIPKLHPEAPELDPSIRSYAAGYFCQRCNSTQRLHHEADLQRHMAIYHPTREAWITVDISPDKQFLAKCKACQTGKRYGAFYNAAAHLLRAHFNSREGHRLFKSIKEDSFSTFATITVLKQWMKEVEEDVDSEHHVSHLAVPEPRVPDTSGRVADFHLFKLDLVTSPQREELNSPLPLNAAFLRTNSEHKDQSVCREAGGLMTDDRSPKSFDDQLLTPYPMRQATATSQRSVDSGYISDSMTRSSSHPTSGDSSHCSMSANSGDKLIKLEAVDPEIDVNVLSLKDEVGDRGIIEVKEVPSETPEEKADTRGLYHTECKGERQSDWFHMKNEPEVIRLETQATNEDHAQSPNFKRKRTFDLPLSIAEALEIAKSEPVTDFDFEKCSAKSKFMKTEHAQDGVYTAKVEPNSIDASSLTAGAQQPLISFDMDFSHPKYRKTLSLPFGHPKSRQWTEMLPSIKACTRDIMGKGNGGALELYLVNGEPTICITCWDPLKLNLALVRSCMEL